MLFALNIEHVLIIMSGEKKVKTSEFPGRHTDQACYKSVIMPPEYRQQN